MKHYQRWLYGKTKIAVTSDEEYIDQLDAFVSKDIFQNRSQAIQEAVKEKLARLNKDEERMLKKLSEHFHEDKFLCGRGYFEITDPLYGLTYMPHKSILMHIL